MFLPKWEPGFMNYVDELITRCMLRHISNTELSVRESYSHLTNFSFVSIFPLDSSYNGIVRSATAQQMSQISKYHETTETRQIAKTFEGTKARRVFEVPKNNIPRGYIISETTDGRKPP